MLAIIIHIRKNDLVVAVYGNDNYGNKTSTYYTWLYVAVPLIKSTLGKWVVNIALVFESEIFKGFE